MLTTKATKVLLKNLVLLFIDKNISVSKESTAGNNRLASMLADVVTIGCSSLSAYVSARRSIFGICS